MVTSFETNFCFFSYADVGMMVFLKNTSCGPPLGDQTIETMDPKKLEFPQESPGGRGERPNLVPGSQGPCLMGRDFTQFLTTVRPPCKRGTLRMVG